MLRVLALLALLLAASTSISSAAPAPVARDDLACGARDSSIRGNVLANDEPPDQGATHRPERAALRSGELSETRVETVMAPVHGELTGAGTIYGGVAPWGDFEYRPASGFVGVDVFAYRLRSGARVSEVATVRLVVGAVQVSTSPGESGGNLSLFASSFVEGTGVLLADRADIEGQRFACHAPAGRGFESGDLVEIWVEDATAISLFDVRALRVSPLDRTIEIATDRTGQRFRIAPTGGGAFHVFDPDSGLAWTAAGSSAGAVVVGRPLGAEPQGAGQTWVFAGPNQAPPPLAFDDEYRVQGRGEGSWSGVWSGIAGNVLGNDVLGGDIAPGFEAVARLASPPEHGELVGVGASIYGGITPWGAFEYRPNPGFVGVDRFTYYALGATGMDAGLGAPSRVATVRIRVGDQVAEVR